MNATFHRFLMAGDKWMPKIHLRQPEFTYSSKKRMQKFKETRDTSYIYLKELDKACFQHDMAYGVYKKSTKKNRLWKSIL